jgi:hypothetical protein
MDPQPTAQQPSGLARQDRDRETIRDWLRGIETRHGVSPRQIGTRSGVAPSTVYRALDDDGDFVMSFSIMSKISNAFNEPMPGAQGILARVGFGEGDLVRYEDPPGIEPRAKALGIKHLGRWKITSEALNIEGFKPGDVLDFDLSLPPERGDIVVAQVYDLKHGSAETVLRLFQPPYLLTRSSDPRVDVRPLYVDGENVVVMGTFVSMQRFRSVE